MIWAIVVGVWVLQAAWVLYQRYRARRLLESQVCLGDVWQHPRDPDRLVFVVAIYAPDGFPRNESILPSRWICQDMTWGARPDPGWYLSVRRTPIELQRQGWRLLMRGDTATARGRRVLCRG